MVDIEWSKFKCRCSGITKIMSSPKDNPVLTDLLRERLKELEDRAGGIGKPLTEKMKLELAELLVKKQNDGKIFLSAMCIEYLMETYAWMTEKMIPVSKESLDLLQLRKGKEAELEAGALLSIYDKVEYKQHKERIENDYLTGEIDFYLGESIYSATNVTDTKNSWDYPTFLKKLNNGLENGQENQLQGYGDITGAGDLFVANCLVTASLEVIEEMKWRVARKMNALTIESPEFLEEWKKWEHSMKFSHMNPRKRVSKLRVDPFTASQRQKVYDRVQYCRDWLSEFHGTYQKMGL